MPFGLPEEYSVTTSDEMIVRRLSFLADRELDQEYRQESLAYAEWSDYWWGVPNVASLSYTNLVLTERGLENMRRCWYTLCKYVCGVEDTGQDLWDLWDSTDHEARNANYKPYL